MSNFSLKELKEKYNPKNLQSAYDYIDTHVFPTTDGEIVVMEDNVLKAKDLSTFRATYLNKLPKPLKTYILTEMDEFYTAIVDPLKPQIDHNKKTLNYLVMPNVKPYNEFKQCTKDAVDLFISFIKEVLANESEAMKDYIIKWLAMIAQGRKNKSSLYLKGLQGIGKTKFCEFLQDYVFRTVSCSGDTSMIGKSAYNKPLMHTLLCIFEELPTFSKAEWSAVSGNLKALITCSNMHYNQKYEKGFTASNFTSCIIATNVEALKDSDGRRYCKLDVSPSHIEDHAYFSNLDKVCFKKLVGQCFYAYLKTIDISKFDGQGDMPKTENKLDAISEHLCKEYKFLKEQYILKNKDLAGSVQQIYDAYLNYIPAETKPKTKIGFCGSLKELGFCHAHNGKVRSYDIKHSVLLALATKLKWIHPDFDEFQDGEKQEEDNELDYGTDNIVDLKKEIAELKRRLAKYEQITI